jgi:hypothetical protein
MTRAQRTVVCLILAGALVVQVLGLAVAKFSLTSLYAVTADSPLFMSTTLAISFLAFRRDEVARQLLVGAALSAALMVFLPISSNGFAMPWKSATIGFWCGAILVSGYRIMRADTAERLCELDLTLVILALPLVVPITTTGLWFTAEFIGRTYDNFLYAFDGLLPIPIARMIAQFCASHPWAWSISTIVYNGFLLVLCAFIILQWRHDKGIPAQLLSRWVFAALIAYGLYYCLPGVGPAVAFYGTEQPRFDSLPSPYQVELTALGGFAGQPRNAMPSLHATWAFLIALMTLRMGFWARLFGAFNAAAMVVVTLGLHEHYLIDLVVAVPLAVAVHAGTGLLEQGNGAKDRLLAALTGAATMTVAWLFIIRYGTASLRSVPEIASALVLATLASSVWLVFRSEHERLKVEGHRNRELQHHPRDLRPNGVPISAFVPAAPSLKNP